ncbi:MAG TPA: hypothetical protein VFW23_08045 [Tepidisphaeraceae bacterium]|nr:hypothetical protein [Tepidisphaeraceae bacterium]
MAPNAVGRAMLAIIGCFLMVAAAIAQQQPTPKPVTPPEVVPGQKPPAAPAIPKGQPGNNASNAMPAAATANGTTKDAEVQPFLGDNLLGVAAIDLKSLDVDGWEKYMLDASADKAGAQNDQVSPADVKKMFTTARKWTSGIKQAGGERLYVVFSLEDVPEMPPFVVIPVPRGSDGSALVALFNASGVKQEHFGARRIGQFVVAGGKPTLDRLSKELSSKPDPDLIHALADGASAPLRFAFAPGQTPRQMLHGASATLPDELGGQPVTVVTQGLAWMAVWISAPPAPRFKLTIQARDANAAEALMTLALKSEDALKAHGSDWSLPFDANKVVALFSFHKTDDRLEISLDQKQTRELVQSVVAPSMARAWEDHRGSDVAGPQGSH